MILILYKIIRHEGFKLFTLIPLKNFFFCDEENRLVDAKCNKPNFYFFRYYHFNTKNTVKPCKEI